LTLSPAMPCFVPNKLLHCFVRLLCDLGRAALQAGHGELILKDTLSMMALQPMRSKPTATATP
jgi:hypothetical protein